MCFGQELVAAENDRKHDSGSDLVSPLCMTPKIAKRGREEHKVIGGFQFQGDNAWEH